VGCAPYHCVFRFSDICPSGKVKEPVSQVSTLNDGMAAEGIYSESWALKNGGGLVISTFLKS
jgi:hypothetical protein